MSYLSDLKEFQSTLFRRSGDYCHDINQKFLPNNPTANHRLYLHWEETCEVEQELRGGIASALTKELCDALYVFFGTSVIYNLPIEEAFRRVHANNMTKIQTGIFGPTGKLLKAPDHPKVDLSDLFK